VPEFPGCESAEDWGDVYLGPHGLAIDQGLVKLPFAYFAHHSRHQSETAAQRFEILHASIFVKERAHGDRVSRARVTCRLQLVRSDLREQFADCQFGDGSMMMPAALGRHHDKSLHLNRHGASTNYGLYRQFEQK